MRIAVLFAILLGSSIASRAFELTVREEEEIRALEDPEQRQSDKYKPQQKWHQFPETDHLRSKRATPVHCPAGWTGQFCESPVCNSSTPIRPINPSDHTAGTVIEFQVSTSCKEPVSIFVDSHVNILIVEVQVAETGTPVGDLFDPSGNRIMPRSDRGGTARHVYTYFNVTKTVGPGLYSFAPNSRTDDDCTVVAKTATYTLIYGGFVESVHSDDIQVMEPALDRVDRYPTQLVVSYYGFTVTNLSYTETANVVSFHRGDNGAIQYAPLVVGKRYGCNANSFVGPYICLDMGDYYLKVRGTDDTGNVWQRVYKYECSDNPFIPVPSTPEPPPVTTCENGGSLVKQGKKYVCWCGPHYTGTVCETKVCDHGRLSDRGVCQCDDDGDYGGEFCQHIKCKSKAFDFTSDKRALAFVVRARKNDDVLSQIAQAANSIVNYFTEFEPGQFELFSLTLFVNGDTLVHKTARSAEMFLKYFDDTKNLWADSTTCSDSLFFALDEALFLDTIKNYLKSPVFLFTDALPGDDLSQKLDVVNTLGDFRSPVFTILYDSSGTCSFSPTDEGYEDLRLLARLTHGLTIKVKPDQIANAAAGLAQGFFNTNMLTGNDLIDSCQYAPSEQIFFVDESVNQITVAAVGVGLRIRLLDTNDQKVAINNTMTVGDLTVDLFNTLDKGHYRLSVDSNGGTAPCHYRVYAQSRYEAFFAASYNVNEDRSLAQPIYQRSVHLVGLVNWVDFPDPENVQAEILIWSDANSIEKDRRQLLFASNAVYRDGCSFNLYFGQWACQQQNKPFYVSLYATDSTGYTVLRTTTGHCATNPGAAKGDCLHGGVKYKGKCQCAGGWTGKTCQTALCLHDGTSFGEYCNCPRGYGGVHCELTRCEDPNTDVDFSKLRVTVSIIMQLSYDLINTVINMKAILGEVIQDMQYTHPEWVRQYTLWDFDDKTVEFLIATDSLRDLRREIELWEGDLRDASSLCKDLLIYDVLIQALSDVQATKHMEIFLFVHGGLKQDLTKQQDLYDLIDQLEAKIHITHSPTSNCYQFGNESDVLAIGSIAAYSGGTYTRASGGLSLLMWPFKWSTGIVHEEERDDCTQALQNFYFPIASEAQTFSLQTFGDIKSKTFKVIAPDGTPVTPTLLFGQPLFDSYYTVMRECNEGWNQLGKYCLKTSNGFKKTWDDARQSCMNDGGVLVTIEDDQTYDFVSNLIGRFKGWIGLNNKRTGTWEWDEGTNDPLEERYDRGWKGGAPPTQTDNHCAVMSADGFVDEDCSIRHDFICAVHAYDIGYLPGSSKEGHLQRGIWTIQMQSYTSAFDKSCGIRVDAQSTVQITRRFDTVPNSDDGEGQAVLGFKKNYQLLHVSSGVDKFDDLSTLEYAQYSYTKTHELQFVTKINPRDQCTYEYGTDAFAASFFSYQVKYTGFDADGYPFQRIIPMLAFKDTVNCENGGVKPSGENRCVCPPNWRGKDCRTPICYGGRIAASAVKCKCYPGYAGDNCELPVCTRGEASGPVPGPTVDRTFGLIVDGSWTGNNEAFLTQFKTIMDNVFSNLPDTIINSWFKDYVGIIAFDKSHGGQRVSQTITKNNRADFETAMISALSEQYKSDTQQRSITRALLGLLDSPDFIPDSPVYIITDSSVADATQMNEALLNRIAEKHATINVIALNDKTIPGGADSYNDPAVRPLLILPFSTGGGFYQVPNAKNLAGLWGTHLLNTYRGYSVEHNFYSRCSDRVEYFQVGSEDSTLILDVFSPADQNLTIINPDGKKVAPTKGKVTRSATNYLFTLSVNQPGVWRVAINHKVKPTFCSVSIRVNRGGDIPQVAFNTNVERDKGHHSNSAQYAPIVGLGQNSIIASSTTDYLGWVNVYDKDTTELVFASALVPRQDCNWNYVSVDLFTCTNEYHTVGLEGYDANGHPFRRLYKTHCKDFNKMTGITSTWRMEEALAEAERDAKAYVELIEERVVSLE
ncbi:hypothetical protein M3Y96_00396900 [Aphelenchoides besseyi]|nr:hypothetical protein M3Y96_00396900 [Aphelenchoides besseyi]